MNYQDYEFLAQMLKDRSGLILAPGKEYLLESRLTPIVRTNNLENLSALVQKLKQSEEEKLREAVTEAMTTNESFFFRDKTPFTLFEEFIIPELIKTRNPGQKLRVWCTAASTGQEPYSLSMSIKAQEHQLAGRNFEIIATDINTEVLEKAKAGFYSQFEIQRGLPIELLIKYFKQVGELWQINSIIRSMVDYRHLNLLDNFSQLGKFDVVFCRNVLIYFDQETKRNILERISRQMASDGYLILGAAETVVGITDIFKPIMGRQGVNVINNEENAHRFQSPKKPKAVANIR